MVGISLKMFSYKILQECKCKKIYRKEFKTKDQLTNLNRSPKESTPIAIEWQPNRSSIWFVCVRRPYGTKYGNILRDHDTLPSSIRLLILFGSISWIKNFKLFRTIYLINLTADKIEIKRRNELRRGWLPIAAATTFSTVYKMQQWLSYTEFNDLTSIWALISLRGSIVLDN